LSQCIVQFREVTLDAFVLDGFWRKKRQGFGPIISGSGEIAPIFCDLRLSGEIFQVSGVDQMATLGADQCSAFERGTAIGAE
jgi:hypothetical protein